MAHLLIFVVTGALLSAYVAGSRIAPYKRNAEDIRASRIPSSPPFTPSKPQNIPVVRRSSLRSSTEDTGLVCGLGCGQNCGDAEQYRYTSRRETDTRRFAYVRMSRVRARNTWRSQCDGGSMMTAMFWDRGNRFVVKCSRLSEHLRKGPKRGKIRVQVMPTRLARINVEEPSKDSKMVLGGRETTEEVAMRQNVNESSMCDESYYLDGIECLTADCGEVNLLCVQLLVDEQLANELLCDLLNYDQNSLGVKLVSYQSEITGGGDLFAAFRKPVFTPLRPSGPEGFTGPMMWHWLTAGYVLPGVRVLGDTEWQSPSLRGTAGGSRCPDGMFVTEWEYDLIDESQDIISESPVSFRCSPLGRDLRIGPQTYRCGDDRTEQTLYCRQSGFLVGMHYNFRDPRTGRICRGLTIECRSLECT